MNENIIINLANNLNVKVSQVKQTLNLLQEGNTVAFIARYRKEATGNLNEEEINQIDVQYKYLLNLENRKEDVIRLIDEKGLLTDELKDKILNSNTLVEVEDLYRPYKEKKKTKASEAIKNGLEPLAKYLLTFPINGDIYLEASKYLNDVIDSTEKAIEGAKYIIAETISDNAEYRKWIRENLLEYGSVVTKIKKDAKDESLTYQMYYDYNERVKYIKPHRILAINRATKEKVIKSSIEVNTDFIINYLKKNIIKDNNSLSTNLVIEAIEDSFKRLIFPSIEREVFQILFEKGENQAIEIFSLNLKNLLLQPPMKGKMVLGIDPAFRTGCKLAVVDETGKLLHIDVIYPHEKQKGSTPDPKLVEQAKFKLKDIIKKYKIEIITIGNGTASRETESFVSSVLKDLDTKVQYIIVSEAGASVYSASPLAKEEFPDLVVEERSAVSIARRLQDPLSELVKIDPKSIGVGQYQHDVTKSKLEESLDYVVKNAVNSVGVNLNVASVSLLQYVSGLNKKIANNIVKYREEKGKYSKREDLLKVPGIGEKSYTQAVGFLRIPESKNKLDYTDIHPESYDTAKKVLEYIDSSIDDIGSKELIEKINKLDRKDLYLKFNTDEYTLNDILDSLKSPLRDLRDDFDKPLLRSDVLSLEDLKEGMELQGTVRNVVDFGVFIDCGLKEDGLLHISKMSKDYIKHPSELFNVGDLVKVYVESVDLNRKKVALTMFKK